MAKLATWIRTNDLLEMSPNRMVATLYDEAIAALQDAKQAIAWSDIESRCNAVSTAHELVGALYLCLDNDRGGKVAENLGSIYGFILQRLHRINFENDPTIADEAIGLLTPLRDSWVELDRMTHVQDAAEPIAVAS
ncbi:flagellar export chaperone FliS [Algihabitans albus]|uniref:flagellar export chaperone FliS n=1 Tax=Algihabitans albus TaxID=2164067 RepID=UPI000E5CC387|nr:flagellar export chaperone FliS [Algihabitans albus]